MRSKAKETVTPYYKDRKKKIKLKREVKVTILGTVENNNKNRKDFERNIGMMKNLI